MAVRPIVLYRTDAATLREPSESVVWEASKIKLLLEDLKDTLLNRSNGIGLAAPQIGVHRRVVVVRFDVDRNRQPGPPIGIINPVIIEAGRELQDSDGCLSIPGLYAETVRPHFIRLQGLGEQGRAFECTLEGFDAVVVHHEVDHLNGVLFIDRVSSPDKLFTEKDMPGIRV